MVVVGGGGWSWWLVVVVMVVVVREEPGYGIKKQNLTQGVGKKHVFLRSKKVASHKSLCKT